MSQAHNMKGFYPANADEAKVSHLPVGASQTLKRGDAVIISAGQIVIANTAAGVGEIAGIMAQDSTLQTAGTLVAVYTDPNMDFIGRFNAASSAKGTGYVTDLAPSPTTGAMELGTGTTYGPFLLINPLPGEDLSSAGARWLCRMCKSSYADTST